MIYVDDMNVMYRGMIMSHMIADSTAELLEMADKIGVKREWIQDAGTHKEHFDVSLGAKKRAIAAGAKEISWRELGNKVINRSK